jgi:preprotein translocase subunit SecA
LKVESFARIDRQKRIRSNQGVRNVSFNTAGLDLLQQHLSCGDLFDESNIDLLTRLNLALQAETLLKRNVDYIVRDGHVELIDEFTGRVAENRRWPYGLQAAIEAKENLEVQPQGRILKSITLQHFLDHYERLSGMTTNIRLTWFPNRSREEITVAPVF